MSGPWVEVRRAVTDDAQDILMICRQVREEYHQNDNDPDHARERVARILAAPEFLILLARIHSRPVGLALLRIGTLLPLTGQPVVQVEHLYVIRSTRHLGVGRALLSATAGVAERLGSEQVIAMTPPQERPAHRFLARMGFAPLAVQRVVATSTLRRRARGSARAGLEDLICLRRWQRARARSYTVLPDAGRPGDLQHSPQPTTSWPDFSPTRCRAVRAGDN